MAGRNDIQLIREAYIRMYEGMITKDEAILRDVLDDSGTLNYYSAEHENMPVEISSDGTAVLTGQSYVAAAVFGGGRSNWRLQQKCSFKKVDGTWKITRSVASTY